MANSHDAACTVPARSHTSTHTGTPNRARSRPHRRDRCAADDASSTTPHHPNQTLPCTHTQHDTHRNSAPNGASSHPHTGKEYDTDDSRYPASFPLALIAHCRRGRVPAKVFRDWMAVRRSATHIPCRYVRIHPRYRDCLLHQDDDYNKLLLPHHNSSHDSHIKQGEKGEEEAEVCGSMCSSSANVTRLCDDDSASAWQAQQTAALRRVMVARLSVSLSDIQPVSWLPCDCFALMHTNRSRAHQAAIHMRKETMSTSTPFLSLATAASRTERSARSAPDTLTEGDSCPRPNPWCALREHHWLCAMDAASMAAVVALRPRCGDCVLDLCCAPANKMNLMADAVCPVAPPARPARPVAHLEGCDESSTKDMNNNTASEQQRICSSFPVPLSSADEEGANNTDDDKGGLVIGVDCSLSRLCVARAAVRRHYSHSPNDSTHNTDELTPPCALFGADGRSFTLRHAVAALRRRWLWSGRGGQTEAVCSGTRSAAAAVVRDEGSGLTAAEERALRRRSREGVCGEAADVTVVYAPTAVRRRLCGVYMTDTMSRHMTDDTAGNDNKADDDNVSKEEKNAYAGKENSTSNEPVTHTDSDDNKQNTRSKYPIVHTQDVEKNDMLFDRVLVDAECTHDGSLAHLQLDDDDADANDDRCRGEEEPKEECHVPHASGATTDSSPNHCHRQRRHGRGGLSNAYRMQHMHVAHDDDKSHDEAGESLFELQLELLMNGYAQLRVGGTLVYSTCSFSSRQNEDVVRAFLQRVNTRTDDHDVQYSRGSEGEASGRHTTSEAVRTFAQVVPAFSYAHERHVRRPLAPCMTTGVCGSLAELQRRLDRCRRMYDTSDTVADEALGSRFWPHEFNTSFQYIVKIVKQHVSQG